ncbi:MAG: hypothetical protein QF704_09250 [Anaerolineales bacterium]|nr:hypothetical protein [Anaerolineales bacterium]
MISVPSFLLKRIYVTGSLRNTVGGFEFQLNNVLGSGYAYRMAPLNLDGVELPVNSTFFIVDDEETAFSDVSKNNPFTLAMNKTIVVWVDGVSLKLGPHKLVVCFDVSGFGTLQFDVTDVVSDD